MDELDNMILGALGYMCSPPKDWEVALMICVPREEVRPRLEALKVGGKVLQNELGYWELCSR